MDPVSYAFAAYLTTVSNTLTHQIQTTMDLNVTALTIQYGGQPVSFQHQLWKVKPASVCSNTKQNVAVYSDCTKDAQRLFNRLCREFSTMGSTALLQRKYTNMYCNAAASFKPIIASLEAGTADSEIVAAKKACSTATVAAMGRADRQLNNERDQACQHYRQLTKY